jgi:hypothetical protein
MKQKPVLWVTSFVLALHLNTTAQACDGPWCECKNKACLDRYATEIEAVREARHERAVQAAHLDKGWRVVHVCDGRDGVCVAGAETVVALAKSQVACEKMLRKGIPPSSIHTVLRSGSFTCNFGIPILYWEELSSDLVKRIYGLDR